MLKIRDLKKSFNLNTENEIPIFQGLNLDIEKNKCTVLIGPNGCGKSTLLNLVGGSIKPDSGKIILNGNDLTPLKEEERSSYIGRVHQNPSMGVAPSLTILENMALADKKGKKFFLRKLVDRSRVDYYRDLLKDLDLGLEDKLSTRVSYLSGGQRQSLSLIMATMNHPDLLLLDEHTAALDPKTSSLIMEKTMELISKHQITTIMISHNMKDAIDYSSRVVMLDSGRVLLDKPSKDLSENMLMDIYRNKLRRDMAI